MHKILVVEDDKNLLKIITFDLKKAGYIVLQANDGREALEILRKEKIDLLLIDWMLPVYSGIDVIKLMNQSPIIIMLTAKDQEYDIIEAFEAGVNDYITKPFSPRILQLRIKAQLKNIKPSLDRYYDITIQNDKRTIIQNGVTITLTKTEFALLDLLLQNENRVVSREIIMNKIWGYDYDGDTRIIDVHISRLRNKIKSNYFKINHVYGEGYIISNETI